MKKIHVLAGVSAVVLLSAAQSALACTGTDCDAATSASTTKRTDIVINLSGNGLTTLSTLPGIVVPATQINSGNITAVTNAVSPVAEKLDISATALANVASFSVDQKVTAVLTQKNTGVVDAGSVLTGVNGVIKDSISVSSTAIGNVFSANLNKDASGNYQGLAAALDQCNSGSIRAAVQYGQVDPVSIKLSSTAIGNAINVANTGVSITVK